MTLTLSKLELEPHWMKHFPKNLDSQTKLALILGEHDFAFFQLYFFGLKIAGPFQREIYDALEDHSITRILIELPRDHGKSTVMENWTVHELTYNPGLYAAFASCIYDQALERSENVRDIFDTVYPFYYLARPSGTIDWAKSKFVLKNRSKLVAFGVGKQVLGARKGKERPGLIIGDDLVPDRDKTTITDLEVEDWFFSTLSNLGSVKDEEIEDSKDTRIMVVGTPYRETDLMANLKHNERYRGEHGKVLLFSALLGKDVGALDDDETPTLWPKKYSVQALRDKLIEVGVLRFVRNFLCRVISDGTSLFPLDILEKNADDKLLFHYSRPSHIKHVIAGVDLATSPTGNYFVLIVVGIPFEEKRFQLLLIERHRGLIYPKQKALLDRVHKQFKLDRLVVESNQFQVVLAQEMMYETWIPTYKHQTGRTKHSEDVGIPRIRGHMDNDRWIFPDHPDLRSIMRDVFFFELQGTYQDNEGKIAHNTEKNDCVMALYMVQIGLEHFMTRRVRIVGKQV